MGSRTVSPQLFPALLTLNMAPGNFLKISLVGAQKSFHPELYLLHPPGLSLPAPDIAQWGKMRMACSTREEVREENQHSLVGKEQQEGCNQAAQH